MNGVMKTVACETEEIVVSRLMSALRRDREMLSPSLHERPY